VSRGLDTPYVDVQRNTSQHLRKACSHKSHFSYQLASALENNDVPQSGHEVISREIIIVANRKLSRALGFIAAVTFSMLLANRADAIGYWNMPGNVCQCLGCGWGPGYHAPLVLGPISCDGFFGADIVRLPSSPSSPHGWPASHAAGPVSYPTPFMQPSLLTPTGAVPTPKPMPMPSAYRGPVLR